MKATINETGEIIDVELSKDGKSIIVDAKTYRKMMSYAPGLPLLSQAFNENAMFEYPIEITNPLK